jgi:catechol 2,3-dioxygenase-like lactoylglutathione lyase family enzyme
MTSFTEVRPFLGVGDVRATAEWYRDVLGFEVGDRIEEADGTWAWVSVRHGAVGLMFNEHHTHEDDPDADHVHPPPTLTGSIYLSVDDVDGLVAQIGSSAVLDYGPVDQPHGMREIGLLDPNGYFLMIGQPLR